MDCCNHHSNANHQKENGAAEGIFTCPMHPEIQEKEPGRCPECGMALVRTKQSTPRHSSGQASNRKQDTEHADQDKHAGHSTRAFLVKFWVSLALTIPVVLLSELTEKFLGWRVPAQFYPQYLSLALSSFVFFYGGWVFLIGGWREMQGRMPGMMTLIGIAISAAYAYSVAVVLGQTGEHTLFWELTTLITVMLLGHWIEMKAVQGTQGALKELSKLLPDKAEVVRGGATAIVALSELKVGDIVMVRPGGNTPADGVVSEGKSQVNESMVTGESKPVSKEAGSEVIAGTINGDGNLKIKVTKIGEQTFLSGIMRLVREAQRSKSRLQLLSDRAASYLTWVAVSAGSIAFISWIAVGAGFATATERLVAVLVIACPHALGLAVPLVASLSTTLAARNGLLVKQRLALEAARRIDVVMFDKTGTLTKGEYGVQNIWSFGENSKDEVLRLAASVDSHSEHFISKAIVRKAKEQGISFVGVADFTRLAGKGVKGIVNGGEEIFVGGSAILEYAKGSLSKDAELEIQEENKKGKTVIYVVRSGEIIGAFALADVIREESREAIANLKAMGVKIAMMTGDSEDVAAWVSKEIGIDKYFSRVLPDEKARIVEQIQKGEFENLKLKIENSGRKLAVAMVGDGINDAPALTQADLGVAIGAGTNVAIESAGIILVKSDPRDIVKIIRLSRATWRKMIQNLFWATGYNVAALPLAAGALASWGIVLQPAFSAVLMSLSTVIVAFNALLLRRTPL